MTSAARMPIYALGLGLMMLMCTFGATSASAAFTPGGALQPSTTKPFLDCPTGACQAISDPPVTKVDGKYQLPFVNSALEGTGENGGYAPKDLQSAYEIPTTGGSGQTVAVIDAYGDTTAEADLAKYREHYGLAACTKTSGCFKKVNQKGEEGKYPEELSEGWSIETSLDLDMVSAACSECHILLVEATGELPSETSASVEEAAKLGATEISNSYGYPETYEPWCGKTDCSGFDTAYDHPSIVVTAAAGDHKYANESFGVELSPLAPAFPASSQYVIAVGGTALHKESNTRGWIEKVWNEPESEFGAVGTGSGCSLSVAKPTWQHDTGCTKRLDNDISAVAACSTPVSIYSTSHFKGWANECGTSASAPLVAGIEAHAEAVARELGAAAIYAQPQAEFDVTTGSDGTCAPPAEHEYFCTAREGYDGPTGMGTPHGILVSSWVVKKGTETKHLKAGESELLSEAITTKTNWVLKETAGAGLTIECTSVKFSAGFTESRIVGASGIEFGPLLFEGCKATAPAGDKTCEVESTGFPSGEIRTQALGFIAKEALEGPGNTPHVRIPPESTREEIVTIQLKGASCANAGGFELKGVPIARIDSPTLVKTHTWEFTTTSGTHLTLGGVAATLTGSGALTLKSGDEWGDA